MALEARPADDLGVTQSELSAVKKALREGTSYLGMSGETLQRYLLQLTEKENLLLSHKLRAPAPPADAVAAAPLSAASPLAASDAGARQQELLQQMDAFIAGGGPSPSESNGLGGAPQQPAEPVVAADSAVEERAGDSVEPPEVPDAKPPPDGPVQAFNKDNLREVLRHMCEYESVPVESTKALRALSSLAYKQAGAVGEHQEVLPQLLRLMDIHRGEDVVQLAATRALCNMAYAPEVAFGSLAHPRILAALLAAISKGEKKEMGAKASEAVARIVAAETSPEVERPEALKEMIREGSSASPLRGLFVAAVGDAAWQAVATSLVLQLMANEVVEAPVVAERFAASADAVDGDLGVTGWLNFAKALATVDHPELPGELLAKGVIKAGMGLMQRSETCGSAQLAGIEAMSSLVGSRYAGLQAFANDRGMELIEAAMGQHPDEVVLQTKGIRALASGVQWHDDIQKKSGYDVPRSIVLTKSAMSRHSENCELQVAALEALAKYLDKVPCVEEVRSEGGEGLVKAMMTKHKDFQKVQTWGRIVLDGIGVDRHWAPRGSQPS